MGVVRAKAQQEDSTQKGVILSTAIQAVDSTLGGLISQMSADGEFKGNLGELTTIHTMGKLAPKRIVLVGLGMQGTITTQSIRRASAIASRHLQQTGAQQIALAISLEPEQANLNAEAVAQAEVEGAVLGLYSFRKYQHTDATKDGSGIETILLVTDQRRRSNTR